MNMLQTRLVQFAREIFEVTAPLMTDHFMKQSVKQLVISSSQIGLSYNGALSCNSDFDYNWYIRAAITDLQETQYLLLVLLTGKPDLTRLVALEAESWELLNVLNSMVEEPVAV